MNVVAFGEIMLRLKSPGYERFFQSPLLEATFGGSEANVAISLAQYGFEASYITVLPDNAIADECIAELRRFGVNTKKIVRGEGRMGLYFLEAGANQRPSKVVYDRTGTAISLAAKDAVDWENVLADADWFHITGITPAISASAAELSLLSMKTAKKKGLTVSLDINFRNNLWKYGRSAEDVIREMFAFVDVGIGNEGHFQRILGLDEASAKKLDRLQLAQKVMQAYPNIKIVALTVREGDSANHNLWGACLYDGKEFLNSQKYDIRNIVDRVGGGDAFTSGLIYGLNSYLDKQTALEFAVAAGCLKHSIPGDINRVSVEEIETLMNGERSGRVQR